MALQNNPFFGTVEASIQMILGEARRNRMHQESTDRINQQNEREDKIRTQQSKLAILNSMFNRGDLTDESRAAVHDARLGVVSDSEVPIPEAEFKDKTGVLTYSPHVERHFPNLKEKWPSLTQDQQEYVTSEARQMENDRLRSTGGGSGKTAEQRRLEEIRQNMGEIRNRLSLYKDKFTGEVDLSNPQAKALSEDWDRLATERDKLLGTEKPKFDEAAHAKRKKQIHDKVMKMVNESVNGGKAKDAVRELLKSRNMLVTDETVDTFMKNNPEWVKQQLEAR